MAVCKKSGPCDHLVTGPPLPGIARKQDSGGGFKMGNGHKVQFYRFGPVGTSLACLALGWVQLGVFLVRLGWAGRPAWLFPFGWGSSRLGLALGSGQMGPSRFCTEDLPTLFHHLWKNCATSKSITWREALLTSRLRGIRGPAGSGWGPKKLDLVTRSNFRTSRTECPVMVESATRSQVTISCRSARLQAQLGLAWHSSGLRWDRLVLSQHPV
jgi:hypothetical protein